MLNDGEVKDYGPSAQVVERPSDPYTSLLLADAPVQRPDKYAALLATHDPAAPVTVSARNVSKVFGRPGTSGAVVALDGVSVNVRRGSIHALVGESGSGKTTLARIIAGLTSFDSGEVVVGDRTLPLSPPQVNRHAHELQLALPEPALVGGPALPGRQDHRGAVAAPR